MAELLKAAMQAVGVDSVARGRRADGSAFCYFDTRDGAGMTLEVRRTAAQETSTHVGA